MESLIFYKMLLLDSYALSFLNKKNYRNKKTTPAGLEPATSRLTVGRANQLRHGVFDYKLFD